MRRSVFVFTMCLFVYAPSVYSQETIALQVARFDELVQAWNTLTNQVVDPKQLSSEELLAIQQKLDALLSEIVEAGQAILKQDAQGYPRVKNILQELAGFFVNGDAKGDGGDQYEKALPIIRAVQNAGVESNELLLWGCISAYCTNDFKLAEKYLKQAEQKGLLNRQSPGFSKDPVVIASQRAAGYLQSLPVICKEWEREKQLRAAEVKADNLPRIMFKTKRGEIVIELFENEAPQAVSNILSLVKKGYYDGVVFHRVLPKFMAQGGDPTGTGSGGPGYNIRCECHGNNIRKHFRGSLSMAHAGRDTGGSQFFLTYVPTSYLNGRHTVFGRVIDGMDVAAGLKRRNPNAPGPKPTPDKIIKAEVLRDRGHAYAFEKLPAR